MSYYMTRAIRKDGRVVLGTGVHASKDCSKIKGKTNVFEISGEIIEAVPRCAVCYGTPDTGTTTANPVVEGTQDESQKGPECDNPELP